jgi:hypothetical protein
LTRLQLLVEEEAQETAAAMRRQASLVRPRRPRAHFSIFFGWYRCVKGAQTGPLAQSARTAMRRQDARDEDVPQEVADLRSKKRKIRDREEQLLFAHCCRSEDDDRNHGCFVEEVRPSGVGSPLD